ncbi:MAG: hypothetical protein IKH98_01815 [Candidatus Methanomethylophilaceae archaeon]|nr:hypothetical protein [Candidatus Methanomethylophilaceae archaeon]
MTNVSGRPLSSRLESMRTSTRSTPSSVSAPTSHCGLLALLSGRSLANPRRMEGSAPW